MASTKVTQAGCSEWKVVISDTMSLHEPSLLRRAWKGHTSFISEVRVHVCSFFKKVWNMVVNDPRKAIHGLKVGFALTVMSLFYYVRPLYDGIGGTGIGAVMTVAVIFDFTVGATIYRAFNRVTATFFGGSLAIGIHYLADTSGQTADPVIRGAFVFLIALVASFARLIPTVKRQYDYGMMTFILTFSLVSISGYRVDRLIVLAQGRCFNIALGSSICVIVCMLVNPIWAGADLHILCVKNMEKLAASLDGCVTEYFAQCGKLNSKEAGNQGLEGYKCVLTSKPSEDSLANLARWEPPHGKFLLQHPWQKYQKIGSAMRNCACCMDALFSYMKSDIQAQAPDHLKKHLSFAFLRLSSRSSAILTELANSMKYMTKSLDMDILMKDMGLALVELQLALKSLPNEITPPMPTSENKGVTTKGQQTLASLPLVEVMPVITIASQLMEISARIVSVVDAVNDIADDAFYYTPATEGKSADSGSDL